MKTKTRTVDNRQSYLITDALNRVIREVRKAKPDWVKVISKTEDLSEEDIVRIMIEKDDEVRAEVDNLIRVIVEGV